MTDVGTSLNVESTEYHIPQNSRAEQGLKK